MVEQHNIEFIYDILSTIRAPFVSLEAEIYAIIEEVLIKNKVIYHREHVLGKRIMSLKRFLRIERRTPLPIGVLPPEII